MPVHNGLHGTKSNPLVPHDRGETGVLAATNVIRQKSGTECSMAESAGAGWLRMAGVGCGKCFRLRDWLVKIEGSRVQAEF